MSSEEVLDEKLAPDQQPQDNVNDENFPMRNEEALKTIPKELLVKHPLANTWVLFYNKYEKGKDWEDCMKQVCIVNTIEDFWALYNNIQLASSLPQGADYNMFKQGVQPMWEDDHNKNGGRWLLMTGGRSGPTCQELLDHYWLELLLAMLGEQFGDNSDQICGAVLNLRAKGNKVSLWTGDSTKLDAIQEIGAVVKDRLTPREQLRYESHKDSQNKASSMVKPLFTL